MTKIFHPAQQIREFALYALANFICKTSIVYKSDCFPHVYCPVTVNNSSDKISILYRDALLSNNGHYMALVKAVNQAKQATSNENFSDVVGKPAVLLANVNQCFTSY